MEDKLRKVNNEFYSLYDSDGDIVASNNPKTPTTKKLSLKNCQAIENGYDLDELAREACNITDPLRLDSQKYKQDPYFRIGFNKGFQKALEILGDKKYTETELYRAFLINSAGNDTTLRNFFEQTVLPMLQQNEWEVEIVCDKDCYSSDGRCDKSTMADCIICTPVTYLKDVDGCLILKRK